MQTEPLERIPMKKRTVQVDKLQRELCTHGTAGFPMTVHHDRLWTFEGNAIPCHWHDDLEIVLVQEGCIRYQIHDKTYNLSQGQCLLINGDVPHSAVPVCGSQVTLLTILIQPVFLYDYRGSDMESICFRPFLHNRQLSCLLLDTACPLDRGLIAQLNCVDDYFSRKPFGFQLKIKSLLCDFFFEILSRSQEQLSSFTPASQEDLLRLGLLLDCLHADYGQSIPLKELAAKVSLTREGCCRFFKRMTGKTISQYVTEYRISQSIGLLAEGSYSIAQIAELCGFSSASRFAAAFHARMGMTPRAYLRAGRNVSADSFLYHKK